MAKRNVKEERLSVRLTKEMEREFETVAEARGLSKSEIARSLIEGYIRDFEKVKPKKEVIGENDVTRYTQEPGEGE